MGQVAQLFYGQNLILPMKVLWMVLCSGVVLLCLYIDAALPLHRSIFTNEN